MCFRINLHWLILVFWGEFTLGVFTAFRGIYISCFSAFVWIYARCFVLLDGFTH